MEWKEEKETNKSWVYSKNDIKISISECVALESDTGIREKDGYDLGIDKELTYSYGKSNTNLIQNDKRVTVVVSYLDHFDTVDEAKAKAEELLPLFESIG